MLNSARVETRGTSAAKVLLLAGSLILLMVWHAPWASADSSVPPGSRSAALGHLHQQAAPEGMRIEVSYTGQDESLVTHVRLLWNPVPAFTGDYVVERALLTSPTEPRTFEEIGRVPSGAVQDGRLRFEEDVSFEIMKTYVPTYRVRTVVGGVLGPPSEERSAVLPPGTIRTPTAVPTPGAPVVGAGTAPERQSEPLLPIALGMAVIAVGAAVLVTTARRRHASD